MKPLVQQRNHTTSIILLLLVVFVVMISSCAPRYGCYFTNAQEQVQMERNLSCQQAGDTPGVVEVVKGHKVNYSSQ